MRLYTWNTAVSTAFYGPLQGLEVGLRNAMHREPRAAYGPAWYDDPACGLDAGALRRVEAARDDLRRGGYPVDPPHLVAALPFGFRVALLGRGGRAAALGAPKRNYEMTLWRPCLHKAFPHARLGRVQAHTPLDYLRTLRNRIAHHEPVFNAPPRGRLPVGPDRHRLDQPGDAGLDRPPQPGGAAPGTRERCGRRVVLMRIRCEPTRFGRKPCK